MRKIFEQLIIGVAAARVAILFLFHAVVFTLCYVFAWLLRFEFSIPAEYLPSLKASLPYVVGLQLVVGALFGFYRGWWRYVGISDVLRLVAGLTTALVAFIGAWYAADWSKVGAPFAGVARGAFLIDWAFALLTLFGARVMIRVGRDRVRDTTTPTDVKRVLIIGAGDAGEALAREIQHRPQLGMRVVGFVDDQTAKWNSQIRGIPVKGPISDVAKIADQSNVDEALIAIPSASGKRLREIIHHLQAADLQFKTMPGVDQLVSGKVQVTQLRPVNIEDLIRRQKIELPGDPVRELFRGKRVLVTGAGGTIGSELASQILEFEPAHLTLLERSEFALYQVDQRLQKERGWLHHIVSRCLIDIRDAESFAAVVNNDKPEIVIHAAAHKHVPLGEENPPEYVKNNTLATATIAEICSEARVERFVFISSDKAINPTNVMGATKRAAEILLVDLQRSVQMDISCVRFGNVLGSSGSAVPLFLEQIASGGPVTVTHPEVTRYFLRTSEAISLVLQAATLGGRGRVFMLDMGEPLKIADLAKELIHLSNHTTDEIPIVFTGMRPGEKLFEEVRLDGETSHPTAHPQIVATEAPQPAAELVAHVKHQLTALSCDDPTEARKLLRQMVPEYACVDGSVPSGPADQRRIVPPSLFVESGVTT